MGSDYVKEFLSGDAVELVCEIEENCRAGGCLSVLLRDVDVFFD